MEELCTEYTEKGLSSRKIISLDNLGIRSFQKIKSSWLTDLNFIFLIIIPFKTNS